VTAVDDQTEPNGMELEEMERGKERSLAEELADKYMASKTYKRSAFKLIIAMNGSLLFNSFCLLK
jgi:hypothetical protein